MHAEYAVGVCIRCRNRQIETDREREIETEVYIYIFFFWCCLVFKSRPPDKPDMM